MTEEELETRLEELADEHAEHIETIKEKVQTLEEYIDQLHEDDSAAKELVNQQFLDAMTELGGDIDTLQERECVRRELCYLLAGLREDEL